MNHEIVKQWIRTTTLSDRATVKAGTSIYEGPIFMITDRGINVGTGHGVSFFKWHNVLDIHKKSQEKQGL
jgi:hypothetical protein